MRKELVAIGSLYALYQLSTAGFGRVVKKQVVQEQEGRCALCGQYHGNNLQCHHITPANALKHRGIMGKDSRDNAVGLCRNGCHEEADYKAIHQGLFYQNGDFVTLDRIDQDTYKLGYNRMPKRRKPQRGRRRR